MMITRNLVGTLPVVMFAAACQCPPEPPPSAAMAVEEFFAGYRGNFREANPVKLSGNLSEALQSVLRGEKESAACVKAREFPSDKPLILVLVIYRVFVGAKHVGAVDRRIYCRN